MGQFKFAQINDPPYYNRDLFASGTLTTLYESLIEAKSNNTKIKNRLKEGELSRLVEIYAAVPPDRDIEDIDPKETLTTPEDNRILGKDYRSMVLMVYQFARGDYSDIKQVTTNAFSAGVPLGLLAYRNYYNKDYESWRLSPELFNVDGYKVYPNSSETLKKILKLDLLLGKALASTYIDENNTIQCRTEAYGLALLCGITDYPRFRPGVIEQLREDSHGRRRGNSARGYGASRLLLTKEDEDTDKFIRYYNRCNQNIKHLLLQKWIYCVPNNTNMITDVRNWDKPMKAIDSPVTSA
jgi:hypothetical protein